MTLCPFSCVLHPSHQQGVGPWPYSTPPGTSPSPELTHSCYMEKRLACGPNTQKETRLWLQWNSEVGAVPHPKCHLPRQNSRLLIVVIITGMGDYLFVVFLRCLSEHFTVSFFCVPSNPEMILLYFLKKLDQHSHLAIPFKYHAAS